MKVDSNGQPVDAGTFGLLHGESARVIRTFVDPTKDDEEDQATIADGGYYVDRGGYGTKVCSPDEFTATYNGTDVIAQDGTRLQVGDRILLIEGASPPSYVGKPVTVKSLYPIGTLHGSTCLSIKEEAGGAPDGRWAVSWGQVIKLVERPGANEEPVEGELIDPATLKVGDFIEFHDERDGGDDDLLMYGTVSIEAADNNGYVAVKLDAASAVLHDEKPDREWHVTSKRVTRIGWGGLNISCQGVFKGDVVTTDSSYPGQWTVEDGDKSGQTTIHLQPFDEIARETYQKIVDMGSVSGTNGSARFAGQRIIAIVERAASESNTTDEQDFKQTTSGEGTEMAPAKQQQSVGKVDVVREGTQIILPERMGLRLAIKELQRQAEQEEMDVAIMEIIPGFPLDAAHAFVKALERKYGWVNAMPTPGFFGPQPPVMIGVVVDPDGRSVQIPWGQIGIPGITGQLTTGIQFVDNKPNFCIGGTVKQKDKSTVNEIALLTKEYLRDHSIYKGKAIKVKFPTDPKKFSPLDHQPKFIPTTDVRPEELIFSKGVEKQIRVNIWTPIQSLAAVKEARVPLKRGVLLFGRYGVGKTLLAAVTARLAVQAGITFMDLVDSNQLPQAVEFGRMLGGMVVIFAEDIDRCDEDGSRSDAFNNILNTVDGLTSKTDEVMIVYTTNHIEKISKAMLRQGRIDKVIHIKEPDADAAVRLVRLYARHMLPAGEDLTEIGRMLGGGDFIPAAIREVVEQSKLAAIERGDVHNITAEDIRVTVEATREHMDLLKETPKDDRSDLEKAADAFGKRVAGTLVSALADSEFEDARTTLEDELTSISKRRVA